MTISLLPAQVQFTASAWRRSGFSPAESNRPISSAITPLDEQGRRVNLLGRRPPNRHGTATAARPTNQVYEIIIRLQTHAMNLLTFIGPGLLLICAEQEDKKCPSPIVHF